MCILYNKESSKYKVTLVLTNQNSSRQDINMINVDLLNQLEPLQIYLPIINNILYILQHAYGYHVHYLQCHNKDCKDQVSTSISSKNLE